MVPGIAEGTSVSYAGLLLTALHLSCRWKKANDQKLPLCMPVRVFISDTVPKTPYLLPLFTGSTFSLRC